ncbi:hypothetical protein V1477_001636 [Vespula maculifrons]|uniref:Uncharacterized protein n=1 Tax=Vespula maculifrons TaxID=7453 RepID=A0ABD2CYE6_VESMC
MPFRFGSFGLLSKLEMYKTPLTDCSTVHTVGFRHLETRPVVSTFRFQRTKRSPRYKNQCKMYELRHLLWNYIEKILDECSNMQPFAREYLQAIRYRYITSTADPGPTAWRLLHWRPAG